MKQYSIAETDYEVAELLVRELKKEGIDAQIVPGGISVCLNPEQVTAVQQKCDRFSVTLEEGVTSAIQTVLSGVKYNESTER